MHARTPRCRGSRLRRPDGDIRICEFRTTSAIDLSRRRQIRISERLAVLSRPLAVNSHSGLQAFITGGMVGGRQRCAQWDEVDVVVAEVAGAVERGVDEAVIRGVRADETRGAVEGFVCDHGNVGGVHERVSETEVLAAGVVIVEEIRGELGHDRRAVRFGYGARRV